MQFPFQSTRFAAAAAVLLLASAAASAQTPLTLAYNPSTTNLIYTATVGVRVTPDGSAMQVSTAPSGSYQGGLLNFGNYPWWVSVADFTAGNKSGFARNGDAYRGTGPLPTPASRQYTVARLVPGTTNVYAIEPVPMTGMIRGSVDTWTGTMHGTITTDGRRGRLVPTNIIDFDIVIEGTRTGP